MPTECLSVYTENAAYYTNKRECCKRTLYEREKLQKNVAVNSGL